MPLCYAFRGHCNHNSIKIQLFRSRPWICSSTRDCFQCRRILLRTLQRRFIDNISHHTVYTWFWQFLKYPLRSTFNWRASLSSASKSYDKSDRLYWRRRSYLLSRDSKSVSVSPGPDASALGWKCQLNFLQRFRACNAPFTRTCAFFKASWVRR